MEHRRREITDIDDLNDGNISKLQILIVLTVCFLALSTDCASQIYIYLDAVPDFRCAVPPLEDAKKFNLTEVEILRYTIPFNNSTKKYETCVRFNLDLSTCDESLDCIKQTSDVIPCDHGYHFSTDVFKLTTATEWSIVCGKSYLSSITNSLFFVGYFVGSGLSGPINDWFGRKLAMYLFFSGYVVTALYMSTVGSYIEYVVFRFLSSMCNMASFISSIAYVNEISPNKYKTNIMMFVFINGALSHTSVPIMGYLYRNWRTLQFVSALLPLPFFLFYPFLPESPRWLLAKNRLSAARTVVEKYAKSNNKVVTDDEWNEIVETEKMKRTQGTKVEKYSIFDLFKTRNIRVISFTVMFAWFTVNILYYGLILNLGHLEGDPFLNGFLLSSIEIASCLTMLIVPMIGKKKLLQNVYLVAGTACLLSTLVKFTFQSNTGDKIVVVLALIGKFGAKLAFLLIYSVTSDVYPTVVRATGLSLGSMTARIGGIATPFIVQVQALVPWLTQTTFGVLGIVAYFTCRNLPETNNCPSLTTLKDAEKFYEESKSSQGYRMLDDEATETLINDTSN